ncbi:MAG: PilZ domain-containing protein, partial [Proteobacteria bacterium]|nr:PilZ domain-containing protein [Pseudomonadota bacterium]
EEKRKYPRVTVNSLAEVQKSGDYSVNVILHDISPDGVQLRCNRKTAHTIHPSGKFITDSTAPEILLKFSLLIDEKEKEVIVKSKIFYFTIIATDVVAFGVKFKQFENFTDRHVETFIMRSFVPVEEKVLGILDTPQTSDDIMEQMDTGQDENINLGDTLSLLRKKKAIVSYEENDTRKFIKLESAIESIFKRLDKIEKQLNN